MQNSIFCVVNHEKKNGPFLWLFFLLSPFFSFLSLWWCDGKSWTQRKYCAKKIKKYLKFAVFFLLLFEYLIFFSCRKISFWKKEPGVFFIYGTRKSLRHGNVKQKYERQNLILIGGIFFMFYDILCVFFLMFYLLLLFFYSLLTHNAEKTGWKFILLKIVESMLGRNT